MKAIPIERLLELLSYDKTTGNIHIKKSNRRLTPDEGGSCTIYDPVLKVKRKIKLDSLAWMLFNERELPEFYKILHKNLNLEDNSGANLLAINRKEYSKVQEAVRNLDEYMKVTLHPNDQYKYILQYRIDGVERRETYSDIDAARESEAELKKYFIKLINRYALTV